MTDPWPVPTRTERTAQPPPAHPDQLPVGELPLTREQALSIARRHLDDWIADRDHAADHGQWPDGKLYDHG
jgi:hypothetical protein